LQQSHWLLANDNVHNVPAGKGDGLIITPFAAGHMIGGSIWRITSAVGEDVVYAVDYNHRKELHLNSTALSNLFSRPALMIADADRSVQLPSSAWPAHISTTLVVLTLCLSMATHQMDPLQ
jgi:hypothetical protein